MNKAFIFDMDGVMIDNEREWLAIKGNEFYPRLFGEKIARALIPTIGLSLEGIYNKAAQLGFRMDKKEYFNA